MKTLDQIEKELMQTVADISEPPAGAYNFRVNGKSIGRQSSKNIDVQPQENGLIITVKANTQDEVVHIPVINEKSAVRHIVCPED